jgi:hypothetical protein
MSMAALMANIYKSSVRSRYMALASQLASEELEELSRYPASASFVDPHIYVPPGSTTCGIANETCVGMLNQDYGPQTITVAGGSPTPVSYFDSICLATQNGVMSETYKMSCTSGATTGNYLTVAFNPQGQLPTTTCSTTAPTGMTFGRRWVIEQGQPVAGVRRVTVAVTLEDLTVQPPVTFQMSMVRP